MKTTPSTIRIAPGRLRAAAAAAALAGTLALGATLPAGAAAPDRSAIPQSLSVPSGQTFEIAETTRLRSLSIGDGAALVAPEGYTVTLTVNGVETGQQIAATGAFETVLTPGTYRGDIVLTVARETPVTFDNNAYDFRQALYVGADGVDEAASVLAALQGKDVADAAASNVHIRSTGEAFNGVVVEDSDYTLRNLTISLDGNGRSDFAGMGAAVYGAGDTTLVVDGATITTEGAVRPAIVAADGANVIVKNSRITTSDGELPSDYVSSVNLSYMQDAPWMLGISGNNRSTNVLGENTQATYVGSSITSENWGALSVDTGSDMKLSAINSTVRNTGDDGYGSYVIGNATETFLGTEFDVATYATIITGGSVAFGDSTPEAVAALNADLSLGLSAKELAALDERSSTITSDRFGFMWHNSGAVDIAGGTSVTTGESTFLVKGQATDITVDGSQGATLNAGNGVLLQMIENDDPGPVPPLLTNTGVYVEPTGAVVKDATHDPSVADPDDTLATFTDMELEGDFFNGMRGDVVPSCPPWITVCLPAQKDLVLTLDGSTLVGVVSASEASHVQPTITAADYRLLGVVTNVASPVVNNGVIVSLVDGSRWTVTGTSYLSSLTVDGDSTVDGTVYVDGVETVPVAGVTYTGDVMVVPGV
ncbi:hypothetical protein [Demequina pelophila]|uniref:hypothetical protein n=1 Tax=Demequina pelophila TaxID=1638984 RepID=UPI000B157663|nr:hypothetical protein [Demequina pelophila]